MPFNFPDPSVATTATNPVTGASYQWKADPGKWVLTGGPAEPPNPPVTIDLVPPKDPQKGDLWIHAETLIEYAWDGTQWFEVGSSCGGSNEEEEDEIYQPFIGRYKLVAPNDFTDEPGTATLITDAYENGDDSYLSSNVKEAHFAPRDLDDRDHDEVNEGGYFHLSPLTHKENATNNWNYGSFLVTGKNSSPTHYVVTHDTSEAITFTEGDIVYFRNATSDQYVRKVGGDTMEGPLEVTGPRLAGDNTDNPDWESTISVLNIENRLGSYLGLMHDGNTKVYVGATDVSIANDIKFNRSQGSIIKTNVQDVLKVDNREVTYLGEIIEEDSLVTKKYVDEADELLRQDIIELEEEIDAIAPSVERGVWRMTLSGNVSTRGQLTMYDDTFGQGNPIGIFQQAKSVWFHQEDTAGTPHGFANVEPGFLLQLFVDGENDYGLFEVVEIHDQTVGSPNPYYAIDVEFVRALSNTSKADPNDLVRMKTFQAPTGGTSSEFVLKTGDQMTGELEFYTEQADSTQDFGIPAVNAQDLRFTTKKLDTGDTDTTHLYKAGYGNYLVSSGALMARGNIYTASSIYGTYFNSDGTTVIKTPRIYLQRSVNSDGAVVSEYGALRWGGANRVKWDNDKIEVDKPINFTDATLATDATHAIHKGYVDEAIRAAGLQLGNFAYRRSSDSWSSGSMKSNTTTNPNNITQMDIYKTNKSSISFTVAFYMAMIKNKMYFHFRDKSTAAYTGRITAVTQLTNGVRLTLTPVTDLIQGTVYYNSEYDVFIGYNKYGHKV